MKKLLFSLMAIVTFGIGANAQYGNSKNTQDNVGVLHNEIVDEYLKKYGRSNNSIEKTIELTNAISKSRGVTGPGLTVKQFNEGMSDIKNNFSGVVNKSSLSSKGKAELQRLFDYMLNNGFKGTLTFPQWKEFIFSFEDQIINSTVLTSDDSVFLLKATSVARQSAGYWNDYYQTQTTTTQNREGAPRWIRWLIVAGADVAGGVAGGGAFSVATGAAASTTAITVIDKAK